MNRPGSLISGWSTFSPLGIGRHEFTTKIANGRTGCTGRPADAQDGPAVGYRAGDPIEVVGARGTRTLDRMTLMVIATVGMVLDEHAATLSDSRGAAGLVLGTSTGSVASITGFTRDTFVQEKPYFVNPATFPNTVINGPAGRTAVWHGLRGLNSTISAGQVTGLAALRYATRMIRRGYARTVLVGAVEELSAPVARAAGLLPDGTGAVPVGEGCVVFLVDSQQAAAEQRRTPVAEVLDFEFGMAAPAEGPAAQADLLAGRIRVLLDRCRLAPGDLWLVSMSQGGGHALDAAEEHAVDRALHGVPGPRRLAAAHAVGNSFSALAGFQLAAVLATAEPTTGPSRPCLLTSLGTDGAVACALVRA